MGENIKDDYGPWTDKEQDGSIDDFGSEAIKNKEYWIKYFEKKVIFVKGNTMDPIKQIKSINVPGKHTIFYMVKKLKSISADFQIVEVEIEITSKKIEVDEL